MTSSVEPKPELTWIASFIDGPWPVSHVEIRSAVAVSVRIVIYIVLAYALVNVVPEAGRDLIGPMVVILPLVLLPALWIGTRRGVRRLAAARSVSVVTDSAVLRDYGVRSVTIVLQPNARRIGLCTRQGGKAWIALNPYTPDHRLIEFVVAHEIGHALRDEWLRRAASFVGAYTLFLCALLSFDYRVFLAGTVTALALWTSQAWISEIACDRIAVRKAGIEAFETFVAEHRKVLDLRPNRTVRRRIRRVFGRLMHPPIGWRLAVGRYLAAR